ncbi:MAG: hypothetical protein ACRERE_31565 [Candidatus Entotheonellia bacterium]
MMLGMAMVRVETLKAKATIPKRRLMAAPHRTRSFNGEVMDRLTQDSRSCEFPAKMVHCTGTDERWDDVRTSAEDYENNDDF